MPCDEPSSRSYLSTKAPESPEGGAREKVPSGVMLLVILKKMNARGIARKKKKVLRVARDKKFRQHSRQALYSASRATLRAKRLSDEPPKGSQLGVALAGAIVVVSLGVMVWRSLRSASQKTASL